jgi:hypothetical protein
LTFDVRMIQDFFMKEISSIDFPQNEEVFYFYGQAVHTYIGTTHALFPKGLQRQLRCTSESPTLYQYDLGMRNSADVTGGKPIAV